MVYNYIVPIISSTVFLSYYYSNMKDIYKTPYKLPTSIKTKIIDFIMASLFSSLEASLYALIAYMISTPTLFLIECFTISTIGTKEEKRLLSKRLRDLSKPFENTGKVIEIADKISYDLHQERIAIIRDINNRIEENNRKGYPYRAPISI